MKFFCSALFALVVSVSAISAHGQALPAASRGGQLQVGVGLSYGSTDIFDKSVTGISGYATYDLGDHLGAEADVHLMLLNTPNDFVENTYLIGPRYRWDKGRYQPYVRVEAGIGTTAKVDNQYQFIVNTPSTNFAVGFGGGVDVALTHNVNARGDFEYQMWPGFGPHALTPSLATIGIAYRFR